MGDQLNGKSRPLSPTLSTAQSQDRLQRQLERSLLVAYRQELMSHATYHSLCERLALRDLSLLGEMPVTRSVFEMSTDYLQVISGFDDNSADPSWLVRLRTMLKTRRNA